MNSKESGHVSEFAGVHYSPGVISLGGRADFHRAYVRGLDSATALLESMIEEIREYWDDDELAPIGYEVPGDRKRSNEVFVVHGRDDGIKNTMARFLKDLGLVPIILHEQPDQGRTVIEKFEQYAQVDFVVALLTPDDVGALRGSEKDLKPRARQNVILELEYFIGKLGRGRVPALTAGDVEIPSDYAGVLYIPMDTPGAWKMSLVRELKTAGFDVDANRIVLGHERRCKLTAMRDCCILQPIAFPSRRPRQFRQLNKTCAAEFGLDSLRGHTDQIMRRTEADMRAGADRSGYRGGLRDAGGGAAGLRVRIGVGRRVEWRRSDRQRTRQRPSQLSPNNAERPVVSPILAWTAVSVALRRFGNTWAK